MRVELTERFQQDVATLRDAERTAVFDAMLALPKALGNPRAHSGLGLRKVHASGIWEVRVGLAIRLVIALSRGTATFVRAGTHDEVRRYLRSL